jgi:hypothetical protein
MYNTAYHGTDPGNIAAIARHAEASGFETSADLDGQRAEISAFADRLKLPRGG